MATREMTQTIFLPHSLAADLREGLSVRPEGGRTELRWGWGVRDLFVFDVDATGVATDLQNRTIRDMVDVPGGVLFTIRDTKQCHQGGR